MAKTVTRFAQGAMMLTLLGTMVACTHTHEDRSTQRVRPIRMPNPATLYCVKKGGKIETHYEDKKGQVNFCRLPDGSVNEEWALFRRDNPKPSNG